VVFAITDNGNETAALYQVDHLGQTQLISTLASGDTITHATCVGQRFLAIAVERNSRDVVYAGPAPSIELREYNNRLTGLDMVEVDPGGVLMVLTQADGVVEVESLAIDGSSQARQIAVGAPKVAGVARLFTAPSGAVLVYPVLEPAFERGVWATPLASDGSANGSIQRINQDLIAQNATAALQGQTVGMGEFFYVTDDGIRSLFLGCAPP
jgi:hypothetical protein